MCPVCLADDSFYLAPHGPYRLFHCRTCDLQFWHPRKNPGSEWYEEDEDYAARDARLVPDELPWNYRQFLRHSLPMSSRILDIGCGTGIFAAHCQRKGYQVRGIDFSSRAIESAQKAFGLDGLYALSLEDFGRQENQPEFDAVTCFEVLEHQDNPVRFITLVKGLLKPGGYIAISVPNRDRWNLLPLGDFPPNHFTRWNVRALRHFLECQGFEIVEVGESPFSMAGARAVVSSRLCQCIRWLGRLKEDVVRGSAKLAVQSGHPAAHAARQGFRLLLWMWRAVLLVPSACVRTYARLRGKKEYFIYCLAKWPGTVTRAGISARCH